MAGQEDAGVVVDEGWDFKMQHVPSAPLELRIGRRELKYNYVRMPEQQECGMATVWKCGKAANGYEGVEGKVLFLFKLVGGWFVSHGDAGMNTTLAVQTAFTKEGGEDTEGTMSFAFCSFENILDEGMHKWDTYYNERWADRHSLECATTILKRSNSPVDPLLSMDLLCLGDIII